MSGLLRAGRAMAVERMRSPARAEEIALSRRNPNAGWPPRANRHYRCGRAGLCLFSTRIQSGCADRRAAAGPYRVDLLVALRAWFAVSGQSRRVLAASVVAEMVVMLGILGVSRRNTRRHSRSR